MKRSVQLAALLGGMLFAESSHAQKLMPNGSFENNDTGKYAWTYWGSAKRDIGLARTGNYSVRVNLQGLSEAIIRAVAIPSAGTYRFSFYQNRWRRHS